jgi:hypothetical protein
MRRSSFEPGGGAAGGARTSRTYWPAVRPIRKKIVA